MDYPVASTPMTTTDAQRGGWEWFREEILVRLGAFAILLDIRFLPLLFVAANQAFNVYLWLYGSYASVDDLNARFWFSVLGGVGLEAVYVGSIVWSELTEHDHALSLRELLKTAPMITALVALFFSVAVSIRVNWHEGIWSALHSGYPILGFAYTLVIHSTRQKRVQKSIEFKGLLDQVQHRLDYTENKLEETSAILSAVRNQHGAAQEHIRDLNEQHERDRQAYELRYEQDRIEWLSQIGAVEQRLQDVQAEAKREYDAEIARERTRWIDELETVNQEVIRLRHVVEAYQINTAARSKQQGQPATTPLFMNPSSLKGNAVQPAINKTAVLRELLSQNPQMTNAEIASATGWDVDSFNTLAGRVRREL